MARPRKSDTERFHELVAHARALQVAIEQCTQTDTAAMARIAESAGQVQRRARLLAGMGRGG